MPKYVVLVEVSVAKKVTVTADNRDEAMDLAAEEVEDELSWDAKTSVDDVTVVSEEDE